MPTLFTALESHVKPKRALPTEAPSALPSSLESVSEQVKLDTRALKAARALRRREPHYQLSLTDRFQSTGNTAGKKIAVIGAGLAGLSAAYELQSVGYDVTVFEAQREVGGRVKSRHDIVNGRTMEEGGQLIGLNHRAWWSYKDKFKLRFHEVHEGQNAVVILGGKRIVRADAKQLHLEMLAAQRRINNAARAINAHHPWLSRRAAHLDSQSLVEGLAKIPMSRRCRLAFIEMLQADNGVEAGSQSGLGNLAMIKGGGLRRFWNDSETHRCVGGAQTLPLRFETELNSVHPNSVHLNTVVTHLDVSAAGVRTTFSRGPPVGFDDVVLAIPPTLWRRRPFSVSPALPRKFEVQFGRNVKFLLDVQKHSWLPVNPDAVTDGPVNLTWEGTFDQAGPRAGMVGFSGAKNADLCCGWNQRRRDYLAVLKTLFPSMTSTATNDKFIDWPANKWTRGAYSFAAPKEIMRVGPLMRTPYHGRLHFAGEHTSYAFPGYMEGALESGLRVAEHIAKRDGLIVKRARKARRSPAPKSAGR
jgi:monoamine oxidase